MLFEMLETEIQIADFYSQGTRLNREEVGVLSTCVHFLQQVKF